VAFAFFGIEMTLVSKLALKLDSDVINADETFTMISASP
jgi:hypothetical protein